MESCGKEAGMPTILYIEDEKDYRETLVDLLRSEKFCVLEAENAEQGYDIIVRQAPDLVLCDVGLPGKSGFDMLSELRAAHPSSAGRPFVFLTALGQKKDMMMGRLLGADEYLVKPVDFSLLLEVIRTLLARPCNPRQYLGRDAGDMKAGLLQDFAAEMYRPLNKLLGLADLMQSQACAASEHAGHRESSLEVQRIAHRMYSMLNNVMETIALLSGQEKLIGQEIDMEELIWECGYAFQRSAQSAACNCELTYEVEPGLPLYNGDYGMIMRALGGLALESAEYGEEERTIALSARDGAGGGVSIALEFPRKEALTDIRLSDHLDLDLLPQRGIVNPGSIALRFARAVFEAHGGWVDLRADDRALQGIVMTLPQQRAVIARAA